MNPHSLAVVTSSARTNRGSDNWQTPDVVLDGVRRIGPIDLDPCTDETNPCGARTWFWAGGLETPWMVVSGLIYVNPPYSQMAAWAHKCAFESRECGARIIALVPARTDTRWWREATSEVECVAFWNGRLTFKGAPAPAPFPSALLAFNIGARAMDRAFGQHAQIWRVR